MTGCSAGGGCYSPALTDLTVMTAGATLFLTGPAVVRESIGEVVSAERLGGVRMHRANGVAQLIADDVEGAAALVRRALSYFGSPIVAARPSGDEDPSATVHPDPRIGYDVRGVIAALADRRSTLEVAPGWARSMVTALARLGGRAVGVIANQPLHAGGVIDAAAAQKAARHVRLCDAHGLPVVTLVDTPGFLPGTVQESAGVIRHGAAVLDAYAAARVPKLTVITRQAYGGAFIAMGSKGLGADFAFAWPDAVVGILGARQAVRIVHRRDLEADDDPDALASLAARYAAEQQTAAVAASEGVIDGLVEPPATRARLLACLVALSGSGRRADGRGSGAGEARCPPVPWAHERHERGDEQCADERGVEEHRNGRSHA
jgi:acetyl-CoA carboxylase carboxyltransferase component